MNDKRSTDWFKDAKWGAFGHYLLDAKYVAEGSTFTAEDWNKQVDSVDAEKLADDLAYAGVGYFMMTVGQNTGYYCSPNAVYDKYVGISPSKCSRRDLIGDVADALAKRGIPMFAYGTSGAPTMDPTAMEKLEWEWGYEGKWGQGGRTRTGKRLAEFQLKWEEIMACYSKQWGSRIKGWWIDGCYFTQEMYNHPEAPNFKSFTDALRAGNENSLIALNPGVFAPVRAVTEHEDYTAGEVDRDFPLNRDRWLKGEQYHVLSYIGKWWGSDEIELSTDFVSAYTREVNKNGGVVTWDVKVGPDGVIPRTHIEFLHTVGKSIR